jgi:hypothetical protein
MSTMPSPPVPYDSTAVRPAWSELPAALRHAIGLRLGAPVVAARTAGAGFTRGFAAVLETADGDRAFVKAAPRAVPLADFYAREAAVTAALPPVVPAARPRWTLTVADHFVLCLDPVDGRVPALPWAPGDLAAALHAWAVAAAALREPSTALLGVGLPHLPDLLRSDLSCWGEVAAGELAMPPVPPWASDRLRELVALEHALPRYAGGAAMMHGDLRLDNVLVDPAGTGWICDWTWPCLGAPWFDTVTLLVSAYGGGVDVDALLAGHPTAIDASSEAVDGALAALGGYWLTRSVAGPSDASPHSRGHQRFSGGQALAWLAARRGWA